MSKYPTAYRAGSRAYAGPQAFGQGPRASSGSGGSNPYNTSSGMGYGSPVLEAIRTPTGTWEVPKLPPMNLPAAPNPYNNSAGMGYSAGAIAGTALRAARYGRAVNMFELARMLAELAELDQRSQSGPGLLVVDGVPCAGFPCGGADRIFIQVNTFCNTVPCGTELGIPNNSLSAPTGRRVYGLLFKSASVIQTQYWLNQQGLRNAGSSVIPTLNFRRTQSGPLPVNWGDPVAQAIHKPQGDPVPTPYRAIPHRLLDENSQAGSSAPPREPPSAVGVDYHMPPFPGTFEKKFLAAQLWRAISEVTEGIEFLECLWKSVPKQYKAKVKGRKTAGLTTYYWNPSWAKRKGYSPEQIKRHNELWKRARPVKQKPQTMLSEVVTYVQAHGISMEQFDQTVKCIATAALVDLAIGKASQQTTANLKSFQSRTTGRNDWLHIGTGPAL